jgi:NAD+ synthase (glutamine-hydrolysing)
VSGGLDSTLALLVTVKAFMKLGIQLSRIHGITMPGFGTTKETRNNAFKLMKKLGISHEEIDIKELALQSFFSLQYNPFCIVLGSLNKSTAMTQFQEQLAKLPENEKKDLVFENVQARLRTFLLMSKGFVIGTGDMSEIALGWCTYNGDHMSMYNPNASIPKTLVKFLVNWFAENKANDVIKDCLRSITQTEISPELLPLNNEGKTTQSTESVLGPYELHDFFLMNFVRYGFSPEKILFMAANARFSENYSQDFIKATLKTFLTRFFRNQFKRSCTPDGPKVGSVSLSPRGDWRMPSDADVSLWVEK